MKQGQNRFIISFLIVPLLLYGTFVLAPFAGAFAMSFTRWRGLSRNVSFAGLYNYDKLLHDDVFWTILGNNAKILLTFPIITMAIALFFAALFHQEAIRGATFFRIVFFFPQVISVSIIAILWSYVYHPTVGILNGFFELIHYEPLQRFPWLGDPDTILPCIIVIAIWQAVGFYMVLLIAGMQSIPGELYEAARIDGANSWKLFWRITVPLTWETIRTSIIFMAIGSMDMFAYVQILTKEGGPSHSGDVLARYLYDQAILQSNFSYGATIGVVLLVIVMSLSVISMHLTRRDPLWN
ncbi:MAG TPA: sugar ABC transporter permease [Aggregatilinea sp.]|uniref:carbohydrate ABC transporter permease n=1 Tax=Aggregatilinea sp. TaxID=2806333 RepID=UPI002B775791|nr:sugar ABC transporter permease [Aggregatilinea sp.]HML21982.1 sugar ABC transporter permease [Aggregatilinea sp.]